MHVCIRFAPLLALAASICTGGNATAQKITVEPSKPNAVYRVGDKVVWHLAVTGKDAEGFEKIAYVVKAGQMKEVTKGELTLRDGKADLETTADAPGTLFVQLRATGGTKPAVKELAGAIVAPEEIKPSAARPADFDAFWKSKLDELVVVPMNAVLTPGDSGKPTVDYWKVTLDNVRGSHVQGQLARPKAGAKLPALLIVQWAGVYPLHKEWATQKAAEGWLTLNINAHDLPIDKPKGFYDAHAKEHYGSGYMAIGNDDRDTSYFLRMYLSCYRGVDYLAARDDWDGKTLVVMGTSQGGLQTLMVGGLHPEKITALIANVPAGCDMTGPLVDRTPGWPNWWHQVTGKDATKVREACRYYDVVNFTGNIKAPTLVAAGLIDQLCPPHGVAAAVNQIKTPTEVVWMDRSDHQGKDGSQAAYYKRSGAWLGKLVKGEPVPFGGQ